MKIENKVVLIFLILFYIVSIAFLILRRTILTNMVVSDLIGITIIAFICAIIAIVFNLFKNIK